jgi:hypothetical protein
MSNFTLKLGDNLWRFASLELDNYPVIRNCFETILSVCGLESKFLLCGLSGEIEFIRV